MKEASEVLARKYRPSNFDELIGQETITQTLSLALDSNRLSHAYLFSGLRGSGKTSTARIFAKALICEEGMSHNPCGKCENCVMAIEGRHMDIVEMDGASSRKIDDIRDLIEQTKYKPAVARYKIFIIDEVHMLTKEAFNALLKTLEEPPAYVKFILATTDPLKLPATILSRTQHFRFKSIATKKIIDHLAHILNLEGIEYEGEALEILARSGSGSLRDTLTLLDQAIIYSKNYVDVRTVTDMLGLVDPKFIADLFSAVFSKDYASLVEYTKVLEDYESEMVVDELIAYLKEKLYEHDALFSTLVLDRFFRILSDAKSMFAINADGSFVLSLIFFKMVEALKIKEIDQMIESMQKEIPKETPKPQPSTIKVQTATPERAPSLKSSEEQEIPKIPQESLIVDEGLELFTQLKRKISDRNYELGECFSGSVEYISWSEDTLTWESCANDECKQRLKHGYSVIKQLVREIFSFETKIKGVACSKSEVIVSKKEKIEPKNDVAVEEDFQTPSMIEDIEVGVGASCVNSCQEESTPQRQEITKPEITQEPMVQKAIELFEAKKVTIQSKI
jgi:DNA polymerase-3 subunit gamma/tau